VAQIERLPSESPKFQAPVPKKKKKPKKQKKKKKTKILLT
jgi:hypothetical protein